MFSNSGYASEIVDASKLNNRIIDDINFTQDSSIRMYFDFDKIAKDNLLIRDGVHYKVKDKLNIDKYLILKVQKEDLKIQGDISIKDFVEKSDEYFHTLTNNEYIS